MKKVFSQIRKVSQSATTILITAPSGTGKERTRCREFISECASDLCRKAGAEWGELTEKQKAPLVKKHKEDQERYDA